MTGFDGDHFCTARALLDTQQSDLVLLDVRVDDHGRADRAEYTRGHLPHAHFVDIDHDLAGPATARSGIRPLPHPRALAQSVRRWGITSASQVVVYDSSRSAPAARAWWLLRWAGITDVRVLDGGLCAWTSVGGVLESGTEPDSDGDDIDLRPGALPVADSDAIARIAHSGLLLDARPTQDHLGRNGSGGHIPGSVSASVFDDFDQHGHILDADILVDRYEALGALDPDVETATYCGSGVAAALQVLVLASIGVTTALYPGSLSQWLSDPARPVTQNHLAGTGTGTGTGE
ncbi:rhodanese-like domain-containing protein [Gordonia sp. CPCC 206044]|uniref:sulfurtransferase n=1 Tax=Gordonia sp. CPCC 206044 TaxID=3140793 RepID=UPI003AF3BF8C